MPDSSDNYQLPSWPPTLINRDLWNAVMGSIGDRLTAREELEADFEALIAQGTQASLDYIQATVAPQIASLQASIELAQEQIDQIVVDGIAPNAAKLGGQLPAYYATAASVTALGTDVGLRATTEYVDDELLALTEAVQIVLDQKANKSITLSGGGLASGGGDLSANRTITVAKATDAEHAARARDDVAATPKGIGIAIAAYNEWETILNAELTSQGFIDIDNFDEFGAIRINASLRTLVNAVSDFVWLYSTDGGATFVTANNYQVQYQFAIGGGQTIASGSTSGGYLTNAGLPFGSITMEISAIITRVPGFNQVVSRSNYGGGAKDVSIVGHESSWILQTGLPASPINALRLRQVNSAQFAGRIHIEGARG